MSLRDVYEAVLVEMNKENAPNILLEDFNMFVNKAISQYVNKRYNIYEINQQVTDDLNSLKGTAIYTFNYLPDSKKSDNQNSTNEVVPWDPERDYPDNAFVNPVEITIDVSDKDIYDSSSKIYKGLYQFNLPKDYFHILNCTCTFEVQKTYRCYDQNDIFEIGATKLTADAWNTIVNNFWNKPTYRRPYFYIHYGAQKLENRRNSKRSAYDRQGHSQTMLCEIRVGTDKKDVFRLKNVTIDYLKVPMFYRLTQKQIDQVEDKSDVLEFPDYVCWEIINELVNIIMENISDPRLQTHPVVSQSIANPTQQQTEPVAQATQ